ncbi:MAG TPA: hypothetical protein VFM69_10620 [Pricia sp.]|nr:hypothetical protein [Pricia sp.]
MKDDGNKKPLLFKNTFDLRDKLTEVYKKGGLKEIRNYIGEEFKTDRTLQIGNEISCIADVQLRHLIDGKPGDVIINYKTSPNVTNSMLLMTANLIDIDSEMQLLIRKKI